MKYAVDMSLGAMIYLPRFIKDRSGIQNLKGHTHTQHGDLIIRPSFFQSKDSRLKK
jgi:hypothetical protein